MGRIRAPHASLRAVAAGLIVAAAAGCGPRPPAKPAEPVVITVAVPQSKNLGPTRRPSAAVHNAVNERLTTYDRNGRTAPKLVERWQQSADGLTWTIAVRPDVTFHDGTVVSVEDVRKAIEAAVASPEQRAITVCLPDVVGVTADHQHDITIRLARPCAFLLEDLEIELTRTGADGRAVGTGALQPVSETDDLAVFRVNQSYYMTKPHIDRVELRSYDTLRAAWADMMRGRADLLLDVGPEGVDFLRDQSNVEIRSYTGFGALAVVYNSSRPQLRERAVRHALSLAVDRRAIVEQGLRGMGEPADSPVWPRFWAYDPQTPALTPNQSAARLALARFGGLTFTCLLPEGYSVFERVALIVQEQLRAVGVTMNLQVVAGHELVRRVSTGDFDAVFIDPVGGPYPGSHYRFWHSPNPEARWNQFHYSSAPVDAALDRMRSSIDAVGFADALGTFVEAVRQDPPALFLAWPTRTQAISRRFVLPPDLEGTDVARNLPGWRLRAGPR